MSKDEAKRHIIQAFTGALDQASFIIKDCPENIFPQLYNRLSVKAEQSQNLSRILETQRTHYREPWFRLLNQTFHSPALIRTLLKPISKLEQEFYPSLWVTSCAFSPDGSQLVSGFRDEMIKLWETASGREVATLFGHYGKVLACKFSPDGKEILSSASSDASLILWDALTGEIRKRFEGHSSWVTDCAFHPSGKKVVSASWDLTLKVWDLVNGQEIMTQKGHRKNIECCDFSPNGNLIVSGSRDRTLKLWNAESLEEIATLEGHRHQVIACCFSPDGKHVLSASADSTLKLWDVDQGKELVTLKGHQSWVNDCAFSPDGDIVISAGDDGLLKLWTVKDGKLRATYRGHYQSIHACAISPNGELIASGSGDNSLNLWDAQFEKYNTEEEVSASFHDHIQVPDFKKLYRDTSKSQRKWLEQSGRTPLPGKSKKSYAFSPDLSRMAFSNPDTPILALVDTRTGQEIALFESNTAATWNCVFSPDGGMLAASGPDGVLMLLDAKFGQKMATWKDMVINRFTKASFSPDGKWFVTTEQDWIIFWDIKSGKRIWSLHHSEVESFAFSPDERLIAAIGRNKKLSLWDLKTRKLLAVFVGHTGPLSDCAFSPNGRHIFLRDDVGQILQVSLENMPTFPPKVTPFVRAEKNFYTCPHCHAEQSVNVHSLGQEGACDACGGGIVLSRSILDQAEIKIDPVAVIASYKAKYSQEGEDSEEQTKPATSVRRIDILQIDIPASVISSISKDVAVDFKMIPFHRAGRELFVAMAKPDEGCIKSAEFITGFKVKPFRASEEDIMKAIDKHYGKKDG